MFLFRRGVKSVGQDIATSPAGRKLILKRLGVETIDETSEEAFETASLQLATEINEGMLKKTQGFARQIDNATSPAQQARLAKNTIEQSAKYADELAIKMGDPELAPMLRKAFTRRTNQIYKEGTKKQAKVALRQATTEGLEEGVEEVSQGFLGRTVGNLVKKYPRLSKGALILGGAGILVWYGVGNLFETVVSGLERFGFIPEGSTTKLIAFWSKLRGFITVAIFVVGFGVIFYVMNTILGTAKAVGAVADVVTPDAAGE